MSSSSYLSCTDHFCGVGGSTTGLLDSGIEVVHAANHNTLAIASHSENYPQIGHSVVDLSKADPRYFPKTTLAWFSPECQSFSPAGGRDKRTVKALAPDDPNTARSRLTMLDIIRFSEVHCYEAVMVEQGCEVAEWDLFEWWLKGMHLLGYKHQLISYNSMFAYPAPTAQSRDRLLMVFHNRGNKVPNVEFCPPAACPEHGAVNAVQTWKFKCKDQAIRVGKWGKQGQYLYTCPQCRRPVIPLQRPASDVLDWSLATHRIGDRPSLGKKPLCPNTVKRIKAGLQRLTLPHLARLEGKALSSPHSLTFFAKYHGGRDAVSPITIPSPTIATNNQLGVVMPNLLPAFVSSYYGNGGNAPVSQPCPTIRTVQGHALIQPDWTALVENCQYRMLSAAEAKQLQGFGRHYVVLGTQKQQFRQIGNAAPPPFAQMLGRAVAESLT